MLYTMQADSMSRFFAMTITDNGAPWTAPDGAAYTVRFGAPGMPAGWYDTITEPGGGTHPAVVVDENTVTVEIAEQAVSAPGQNILCVLVTDAQGYQIASWPFVLSVQAVPGFDAPEATVYYNALTAQVAQVLASQTAAAASASAAAASETAADNSAAAAAQSAQEAASAVTGVVSFNERQGAVVPQTGDYTPEMVGAPPSGSIVAFAGADAPNGWLLCDGSAVSRATYAALFEAIGTIYGDGDGSTTFNLPNLIGRVVAGAGGDNTVGTSAGSDSVTLTINQIPAHKHNLPIDYGTHAGNVRGISQWVDTASISNDGTYATDIQGGGQSHENRQPTLYINYIIKI